MTFVHHPSNAHRHVAEGTDSPTLDVLGPTLEYLTSPEDSGDAFAIMRGVIPPGAVAPLHSHDDAEAFFVIAGVQQVLTQGEQGLEWNEFHAGDYVYVPPGTLHAHRNASDEPLVDLVVTSARLGRFFQEVGKPATASPRPPTPEDVERFVAASARYGYTLGTPEQNRAVGIDLPTS
jgi:quercetin dioxygenase-like cupin family protein